MKQPSYTDLLYLYHGDACKAALAANLPLPKGAIAPSPSNYLENKKIKDLINKTDFQKVKSNPIIIIDSIPQYLKEN